MALFLVSATAATYANAAIPRNQAVPVQKVEYGEVISVRQVDVEEIRRDQYSGWKTFGGAVLGGVIGHQFGGGSGQDVATVLGALAGAGIANRHSPSQQVVVQQLDELLIRLESDGSQLMVLQQRDAGMRFSSGNTVRVVYLQGGQVRVDRAM
nr:glycine zipper 2TM domain-containing protein [Ferrimonas senticii]